MECRSVQTSFNAFRRFVVVVVVVVVVIVVVELSVPTERLK